MRAIILGSSSQGNAVLFESKRTRVLVDAGLTPRVLRKRAKRVGVELDSLDGVVVTHGHRDHSFGAGACATTFDTPVYFTEAARRGIRLPEGARTRIIGNKSPFTIGDILLEPLPVPHDAPQVAFVVSSDGYRAGMVTDLGHVRSDLIEHFRSCRTLLVESNYCPGMLESGPYSRALQARVSGPKGHLSNHQTAALLTELKPNLDRVALLHLSEKNNTPDIAEMCARNALAGFDRVELHVAPAAEPMIIEVTRTQVATQLALSI